MLKKAERSGRDKDEDDDKGRDKDRDKDRDKGKGNDKVEDAFPYQQLPPKYTDAEYKALTDRIETLH